jgi:hypothetical protein
MVVQLISPERHTVGNESGLRVVLPIADAQPTWLYNARFADLLS